MRKLGIIFGLLKNNYLLEKSEWYWVYRVAYGTGALVIISGILFILNGAVVFYKLGIFAVLAHIILSMQTLFSDYIYDNCVVAICIYTVLACSLKYILIIWSFGILF